MTESKAITIGALARRVGINVETIRYYQRRGLLAVPAKPLDGYRHYSREDLDRLCFIKRAQKLGFSLDEIASLLQLGQANCAETRALATLKLALVEDRIADLERIASTIRQLVQRCDNQDQGGCPIVASLSLDATGSDNGTPPHVCPTRGRAI